MKKMRDWKIHEERNKKFKIKKSPTEKSLNLSPKMSLKGQF